MYICIFQLFANHDYLRFTPFSYFSYSLTTNSILPVGEHKIGFKGSSVDFTTGAKNTFVSDANYNVVVK